MEPAEEICSGVVMVSVNNSGVVEIHLDCLLLVSTEGLVWAVSRLCWRRPWVFVAGWGNICAGNVLDRCGRVISAKGLGSVSPV